MNEPGRRSAAARPDDKLPRGDVAMAWVFASLRGTREYYIMRGKGATMSQALPEHIEALIDHGSTMRAEDDAAAFLIEVADALEAREINEHQAYALASMLGFSRDQLRATTRQSN